MPAVREASADTRSVTTRRNYTDVLPTFNFVLDVTDSQKIRFGAARVVSPQNLNDIGRGLQYGFTRAPDGPGGTGKSHLAAAFAERLWAAGQLDLLAWLDAAGPP